MKSRATLSLIILLLLILYLLQGVIIGFISTIPLYLDSRGAKWNEQGTFNFVFYPFSLKLAWAPIIDAVYFKRFGRRKSWLLPIQYSMSLTLFILSFYLMDLIEELKVKILTGIFFFIYFLLACQDICVDGWALTLLTDYNRQWAPTCQTVGQTIGRFIGFTVLMTLESANFTNRFLRKPFSIENKSSGLFTINQFLRFWAIGFVIVSSIIGLFVREKSEEKQLNLKQTYFSIGELLKKKCVQQLAILSLLSPIGYAATYSMTYLVLKRYGIPQETLGLLNIPLITVKIIVPFCITDTQQPLTWFYRSYIPRLFMCVIIAVYIHFTPSLLSQWYFYPILIVIFVINESVIYLMLVSRIGFYTRISDPRIGGTYITLLTTLGNLGAGLTTSFVLFTAGKIQPESIAYSILVGICFLLGWIWLASQYRTMRQFESLPLENWYLQSSKTKDDEITREKCLNEEQ